VIAVPRGSTSTHAHLRRRVLTIVLVTLFFAAVCTLIIYFSERSAHGTQIHSFFDAFLFSTSQLLTASSVANPTTQLAKVLELFFDIYAITVVATLAGSFRRLLPPAQQGDGPRQARADCGGREAAAEDLDANAHPPG
jgi:hypothetical protein